MADYDKLKVTDLKDLVKERGIASTDLKLKQHFVDALLEDDSKSNSEVEGEIKKEDEREREQPAAAQAHAADAKLVDNGSSQDVDTVREEAASHATNEIASSDTENPNKRKRRSATPPLREESVAKKLKAADEEPVKLPEDVAAQAPVPMDEDSMVVENVLPYGTSDDVMDVTEDKAASPSAQELGAELDKAWEQDSTTSPSNHEATRAIYISNLVRPLQPAALREHILALALPQGASADSPTIQTFHLDKLRTHALVLFDSIAAASRVRAALHDKVWPEEAMRKSLWVDFTPDDKVESWIDTEVNGGDRVRWEVVYNKTDAGVVASLQEAAPGSGSQGGRKPSFTSGPSSMRPPARSGEGMPNAPSGPRRQSAQMQQPPTPQSDQARPSQSKSFDSLDSRYKFTETRPKIYYLPAKQPIVEARLEELAQGTSRDWDDTQADPSQYQEGELRRYTFEDDTRLVDSGADFGLFGRRPGSGGGAPRGRGRGGGPPRGGQLRLGGDSYRGGGSRCAASPSNWTSKSL